RIGVVGNQGVAPVATGTDVHLVDDRGPASRSPPARDVVGGPTAPQGLRPGGERPLEDDLSGFRSLGDDGPPHHDLSSSVSFSMSWTTSSNESSRSLQISAMEPNQSLRSSN